jgi:ABC-type transporter Mla subunit MlaD
MPKNGTTPGLDRLVLRWMTDMGERLGAERVGDALTGALAGVAKTRAAVDRNVASLFSIAGAPSRREMERVQERLDALQGSVANLSRRLDVLARAVDHAPTPASRTKKTDKASSSSARKTSSGARKRSYT